MPHASIPESKGNQHDVGINYVGKVIAMNASEAISKRIIMLCQERRISIEQLVEKVNANSYAVMAVVRGHADTVPLDLMGEICLALGITMTEFFNHSLFEGF